MRRGSGCGQVRSLRLIFPLFFLRRPVGGGSTFLLSLECGTLGDAGGGLLELGVATQVLQGAALLEVHHQLGDVVAGEVLHAHGATALDVGGEGAELVEVDLVALEQEFADAGAQLAEDAEDGALAEHAVVLADVGGELAKADDAGELELGISLIYYNNSIKFEFFQLSNRVSQSF